MSLTEEQENAIFKLFQDLRPDYRYSHINADEITKILSNPSGGEQELHTLNYAYNLKSDAMRYVDFEESGDAEGLFKDVAKIICNSKIPAHWTVSRELISQEPSKSFDGDYEDHCDIFEFFSWTSNGILYEIWSDHGENWFFKGTHI